jgi:tetratricopeptide (TPR) repeat protein
MLSRMAHRRARALAVIGVVAVIATPATPATPATSATSAHAQDSQLPVLAIDQFPAAARAALSRAYKEAQAQPRNAATVGALGRMLHAWEQWDGAHVSYSHARTLAPRTFDWAYLDAVVLQRLARHAEAVTRLEEALAITATYLPARVRLAEGRLEIADLERSRREFEALAREPAAEPAARVGLGRIAAMQGRHADAVGELERAVSLYPELGAAYYALARSYRALGRTDDAVRALEQHARHGARWPAIEDPVLAAVAQVRDDPRALVRRGVTLSEVGDLDGAIKAHEAGLAADPSMVDAHANLVNLYGRARNWPKVEEHYRAAVAAHAEADVHYDYGVLQGLQERWEPAEEAYRRALAINPLHAPARNNLGQLLERRRDFEAAAAEYRRALDAQPTFRLARFNLGRALLALGRPADAIVQLEQLQQPRDAEAPRYLFGLATAHVRAGHKDDGLKWAIDARQLAIAHGQKELADAIDREIARLK